jgi:hypothetical protein
MSSKTAVSALESAPPADIVQLSVAATQLQSVDAMFGISTSPISDMSSTLASLEGAATGSSGTASAVLSTASPADQFANYEQTLQAQVTQGLFGSGITTSLSGTLFNGIG